MCNWMHAKKWRNGARLAVLGAYLLKRAYTYTERNGWLRITIYTFEEWGGSRLRFVYYLLSIIISLIRFNSRSKKSPLPNFQFFQAFLYFRTRAVQCPEGAHDPLAAKTPTMLLNNRSSSGRIRKVAEQSQRTERHNNMGGKRSQKEQRCALGLEAEGGSIACSQLSVTAAGQPPSAAGVPIREEIRLSRGSFHFLGSSARLLAQPVYPGSSELMLAFIPEGSCGKGVGRGVRRMGPEGWVEGVSCEWKVNMEKKQNFEE